MGIVSKTTVAKNSLNYKMEAVQANCCSLLRLYQVLVGFAFFFFFHLKDFSYKKQVISENPFFLSMWFSPFVHREKKQNC